MSKPHRPLSGVPLGRISHTLAFIRYLRSFGVPTDRYLTSNKLPTLCEEPGTLIPVPNMYRFLAAAAHEEELLLGWSVGEALGYQQLSAALRRQLETAPTLLMALKTLVALVNSETSDIDVGIKQYENDIMLYTTCVRLRGVSGYSIAQAYHISVFVSLVQQFLGKDWRPATIGLECQRTHADPPEHYQASRISYQSEFGYFTVPRFCLHRAIGPGHGERTANTGLQPIDQTDTLELMRRLLSSYLAEGYVSQSFAAELLDTSVRSLTRRLSKHGTTYQSFIDGLRFQVAREHLMNPDIHIIDAAHEVGFSDQGDFSRMFRRVSGMTPAEFRRTNRTGVH